MRNRYGLKRLEKPRPDGSAKQISCMIIRKMKICSALTALVLLITGIDTARAQAQDAPPLPKTNTFRLSPISVLDLGVGFGAGYERLLGTDRNIGIVFPFYFILQNKNSSDNLYSPESSNYNTYLYFTPGVKFYPYGHKKVTYSLGPSLMIGVSDNRSLQVAADPYGSQATMVTVKYRRIRMGALMNNYVTFAISPSLDLGLEGGLGVCYFDKESFTSGSGMYPNSASTASMDLTGQFSLSLGFKF